MSPVGFGTNLLAELEETPVAHKRKYRSKMHMQLGTVSELGNHLRPVSITSFDVIAGAIACGLLPRLTILDAGVSHFPSKWGARKSVGLV